MAADTGVYACWCQDVAHKRALQLQVLADHLQMLISE